MNNLEFYVRLVLDEADDSLAKTFYKIVKSSLLPGLMISFEVPREHYGLDSVLMRYKRNNNKHYYEIPLSRHLEYKEYLELLKILFTNLNNQINIEVSSNFSRSMSGGAFGYDRDISQEINGTLAKFLHNNWVNKMLTNGWRYGVDLDYDNKVSPFLVDWDYLPEQNKTSDITLNDFVQILGEYGYQITKYEAKTNY